MTSNINDFQGFNEAGMDAAMTAYGAWGQSFQAMTSEIGDYTQRSFENSASAFEKLMAAGSVEQLHEIQSLYAKQAYDDYMVEFSKLGSMYTQLWQEACKPLAQTMQSGY